MQPLTFDGFDLTRHCLVTVERPVGPSVSVSTAEVAGRDGDVVVSARREPVEIIAHCTLRRSSHWEWPYVRSQLAAALSVRGERVLTLPDEPGLWRMATASLDGTMSTPLEPPASFDVRFCCHDPVARGHERRLSLPSAGTLSFNVGGSAPCGVLVEAAGAVRGESGLWGMTFDGADSLRVPIPTGAATAVSIDCERGEVRVGGDVSMITLESDWPELAPGSHTCVMDVGTGDATVTILERWL